MLTILNIECENMTYSMLPSTCTSCYVETSYTYKQSEKEYPDE